MTSYTRGIEKLFELRHLKLEAARCECEPPRGAVECVLFFAPELRGMDPSVAAGAAVSLATSRASWAATNRFWKY